MIYPLAGIEANELLSEVLESWKRQRFSPRARFKFSRDELLVMDVLLFHHILRRMPGGGPGASCVLTDFGRSLLLPIAQGQHPYAPPHRC